MEDYAAWRAAHPIEAAVIEAESPRGRHRRCPVHDAPLVTVMGWRSRLECLPAARFIDDACEHPFCLDVGERLTAHPGCDPVRLIFCRGCEEGMRARGW